MARMTPWREWLGAPRGAAVTALVASAAAVTAATFSSSVLTPFSRFWRGTDGTQIEREARLAGELHSKAWLGARRVQLRDSLRALARPGVSVLIDRQFDTTTARRLESRIRLAWAAFSITDARMPVVLAGISAKRKDVFTVPSFAALPMSMGEPCLVVVSTSDVSATSERESQTVHDARRIRELMFGCALFARYGLPGAAVGAELRRIAWAPVSLSFDDNSYWYWWRSHSTLESAPYVPFRFLPYFACAAGRLSACTERAGLAVTRFREIPPFASLLGSRYVDVQGQPLLALLQASLSRGDFERLWRDGRSFDVAVRAISGRDVGDWMHQLILRTTRPFVSSFSPVSPLVARALLLLALAAIAAAALQTRRTITD